MNNLPNELILLIMEEVMGGCHTAADFKVQPYRLAGVCRQWYDLITDRPKFWTTIVLSMNKTPMKRPFLNEWERKYFVTGASDRTLANISIGRAKTLPLHFIVEACVEPDLNTRFGMERHRMSKFAVLIKQHLDRIESLDITVGHTHVANRLADKMVHWREAPMMKSLSLTCLDPFGNAWAEDPHTAPRLDMGEPLTKLPKLPVLQSLTLSVPRFFRLDMLNNLPTLESLTLTEYDNRSQVTISPATLLDRLQTLPELKHLAVCGRVYNDPTHRTTGTAPFDNSDTTYTLPALESLSFEHMYPQYNTIVLDHIVAPQLTTLYLGDTEYNIGLVNAFRRLAPLQNTPLLHTFHIYDTCYTLFQELLFHLDWVVTLTCNNIADCGCSSPHFSAYAVGPGLPSLEETWQHLSPDGLDLTEKWFCPKLEVLNVEAHGFRHCRALRRMLRRRKEDVEEGGMKGKLSVIRHLIVTDCQCHEPLPDKYRAAFAELCEVFDGPEQIYKVQKAIRCVFVTIVSVEFGGADGFGLCRREDQLTWYRLPRPYPKACWHDDPEEPLYGSIRPQQ